MMHVASGIAIHASNNERIHQNEMDTQRIIETML